MKPTSQVVENVRLMFKDEDADYILENMRWSDLLEHWLFDWAGMSWEVSVWGDVKLHSAKFLWDD